MSDLQTLLTKRDQLLNKMHNIEESCEGIENANNSKRKQQLDIEIAKLSTQKQELSKKLSEIDIKLSMLNSEIATLASSGVDKILEAIKKQRWYYFKNKTHIMFDKNTGLLWNNPENIPFYKKDGTSFTTEEAIKNTRERIIDGFDSWKIVTRIEFDNISTKESGYPYYTGSYREIDNTNGVIIDYYNHENFSNIKCVYTSSQNFYQRAYDVSCGVYLIFSRTLVKNSEYKSNVSPTNRNYTERERLQFTLDLFTTNNLLPIFDDPEITELYRKIYFEKPQLLQQLQEVQSQIEDLQKVVLLSSTFDYATLLSKYDINSINSSIIQYYQAIQQWIDELLEKLDYYEQVKNDIIRDFNIIGLKLAKKYESSDALTQEENLLLRDRQRYFASRFSLGMNGVKSKLLAIKHQADDLEYRIDEIDNGEDAIHQLALLEKEERASFSFIAENTAKIIRNALKKIEFFEANHQYVVWAVQTWEKWTNDYRVFKTTCLEHLKHICEEDCIEEEVWKNWYLQWQSVRFKIEKKIQPIIEKELRERIAMVSNQEKSVAEQIVNALEIYKNAIDNFYKDERKGIYQNFVFQSNGEIQERLETESKLYKLTAQFQQTLQGIIFNCAKAEDRIFILNLASDLLDIQIDEVLALVANHDLTQISNAILTEFSKLKQKNYEIYLADAKSYGEEQSRRDKQFNSLIFKMRKGLLKK